MFFGEWAMYGAWGRGLIYLTFVGGALTPL